MSNVLLNLRNWLRVTVFGHTCPSCQGVRIALGREKCFFCED